jgi:hypothetical protein
MATRQDSFLGDMNVIELTTLRDPVPAQVAIPSEIANRHHNLMAGWGRPNMSRGMYLRATGATSLVVPLRVPPGVTLMDATLLVWGTGSATLTTAADATGTTLSGQGADVGDFYELGTAGPIDASEGATSRRAIQVVASESWAFTDIDVTLAIATATEFGVAGIVWRPVVQRRT